MRLLNVGMALTIMASVLLLGCENSITNSDVPIAMVFAQQPTDIVAGGRLNGRVALVNQALRPTPISGKSVSVTLESPVMGGQNEKSFTLPVSNGVVDLSAVQVTSASVGYTVLVQYPDIPPVRSTPFSVMPGPITRITINPTTARLTFPAGAITVKLEATGRDAYENAVPAQFAWETTDPSKAIVSQNGTVTGNGGVTTVRALAAGKAGTATVFSECVPERCTSAGVHISSVAATNARSVISPNIVVTSGTGFQAPLIGIVTIGLGMNSTGAILSGTLQRGTDARGTAVFDDLKIDRPGVYTFVAFIAATSGSGLAGATSNQFIVTL